MAMLAERKSKSKWVLNPRGTNAINEMEFGRKMLEKMGWSAGEGLGVQKQGVKEPLRVQYKNDVKGVGYKKNADNEWLKVEDEFSKILQDLSNNADGSASGEMNIESLEKKSEGSKARLHYRKFTRNKDLSRYSEKDLSCILGHTKSSEAEPDKVEEEDTKFSDKGTINSYFDAMTQKKLAFNSSQGLFEKGDASPDSNANSSKSKKKRKSEMAEYSETSEFHVQSSMNGFESTETESEPRKKKSDKKNKSKNVVGLDSPQAQDEEISENQCNLETVKPVEEELEAGFDGESLNFDNCLSKSKKKKRKKEALSEDCGLSENLKGVCEETEGTLTEGSKDFRPEVQGTKFKHTKRKQEDVHETEAAMNINIVEDGDHIPSLKNDKKRKKKKMKKCKSPGSPKSCESSVDSSESEDKSKKEELSNEIITEVSCDEVKKKRKKRKHNELQETEECSPNDRLKLSVSNCDESTGDRKYNSINKKASFSSVENQNNVEEAKASTKKVRFSLDVDYKTGEKAHASTSKVRFSLNESHATDETETLIANCEDINTNEKKRKKKSKHRETDTERETGKLEEVVADSNILVMDENSEGVGTIESTCDSNLTDDKVSKKVKKSKKRKLEKLNELEEDIPCEILKNDLVNSNCLNDDEGNVVTMVTKKSKRRKTEVEDMETLETTGYRDIMNEDLVERAENVVCSPQKENKKKSKKSEKRKPKMEEVADESSLEKHSKKSKVDCSTEQEYKMKRKSTDQDQTPMEGCDNMTEEKIIDSMEVDNDQNIKKKKKKSRKFEILDEDESLIGEENDRVVSKESKANEWKDSSEVSKSEVNPSSDCGILSNSANTNVSSKTEPISKKEKLLALLKKTTADDSDESDCSDSVNITEFNLEEKSSPRSSSSLFKGSNFEKLPGYNNPKAI